MAPASGKTIRASTDIPPGCPLAAAETGKPARLPSGPPQ